MASGTLKVDILGTSFTIQAEETSTYLDEIYNRYKKTVSEIEKTSGIRDPLRVSILAGMMLSDEIQKIITKNNIPFSTSSPVELAEAEKLTLKMINSIDSVL
ncbi:MAG: cell division protein ZapA [Treponemataceae bacterium]